MFWLEENLILSNVLIRGESNFDDKYVEKVFNKCSTGQSFIFPKWLGSYKIHTLTNSCKDQATPKQLSIPLDKLLCIGGFLPRAVAIFGLRFSPCVCTIVFIIFVCHCSPSQGACSSNTSFNVVNHFVNWKEKDFYIKTCLSCLSCRYSFCSSRKHQPLKNSERRN